MEHSPVRPTSKGPAETFTGDVYVTPITGPTGTSRLTAALVRFTPGARSHWHSHDVGQTLHGAGRARIRRHPRRPRRPHPAGRDRLDPPGEEHWHGATEDTLMAHYALLDVDEDGSDPARWLEPVTDEQYRSAHDATR